VIDTEFITEFALSLPGAQQSAHFDVTDFRVNNKIFCTLPKPGRMGLRITPVEQAALLAEDAATFSRPENRYGQSGWTFVQMSTVDPQQARELITDAWRLQAPKRLLAQYDSGTGGEPAGDRPAGG